MKLPFFCHQSDWFRRYEIRVWCGLLGALSSQTIKTLREMDTFLENYFSLVELC